MPGFAPRATFRCSRLQRMPTAQERLASALSDRYRIEREIRSGGMAIVYLAHDVRPEGRRRVAIKVLPPPFGSGLAVEEFMREVKVAAYLVQRNSHRVM